MNKKMLYSFFGLILILVLIIYTYTNHIIIFSYIHPNTNTQSFKYIAKTISILDKAFYSVKKTLNQEGIKIKYVYENAYGSGFIKNNPIPNDLDYTIGIDLGEFEYTGSNKAEIANQLIETMNIYELTLIFYINSLSKNIIASKETPLVHLDKLMKISKINKEAIKKSIDLALDNKAYIQYSKKGVDGYYSEEGIEVPFIMDSGEILLEDRRLLKFFSNAVDYGNNTNLYMKEISIIPEFFATIKYNNKRYKISFVVESSLGGHIQLARRLYIPQTFINLN